MPAIHATVIIYKSSIYVFFYYFWYSVLGLYFSTIFISETTVYSFWVESTTTELDVKFVFTRRFRFWRSLRAIRSLLMWYFNLILAVSFSSWVFGIFDRLIFVTINSLFDKTTSFCFRQHVCPISIGGGVGLNRLSSVRSLSGESDSSAVFDRDSLLWDRYFWNCSSIFSCNQMFFIFRFQNWSSIFVTFLLLISLFWVDLNWDWVILALISSILLK